MVQTKDGYMDGYLQSNLDISKEVIKKDWDMVFIVDGGEGSGKSTLAMQMAKYCDPTLTLDRVVFTPSELRKAIIEADKFQAVIYDEAYTGLSSRATMSLINRTLISMLAEIRQKNLFVFVVMPTYFDLDKYVALWRSRVLIHVYTRNYQRGYFAFYNYDKKKMLYVLGKKYYSYGKPKANFIGRFTKYYVVNAKAYLKKKKESLLNREKKREDQEKEREINNALFERLLHMDSLDHKTRMDILSMSSSSYFYKLKQTKDNESMENM